VLIVNKSKDSREVLKTALERRGMEILEAAAATEGLALAQQHRPRVIVLDLEDDPAGESAACDCFTAGRVGRESSLVVLGSVRLCQAARRRVDAGAPPESAENLMAKPYHFAPLIRKIEELAG
jgi:CheY-like chemotaxis protein